MAVCLHYVHLPDSGPAVIHSAATEGGKRMSRRTIGTACGLAAAAGILMLPGVGALEPIGVRALAIIVLGVVFWATDVLNAGITAVMTLGLLMIAGVPGNVALAGFADRDSDARRGPVLRIRDGQDRAGAAHRVPDLLAFPPTYGHPRGVPADRLRADARHPVDDRPHRHPDAHRVGARAGPRPAAAGAWVGAHHPEHLRDGGAAGVRAAQQERCGGRIWRACLPAGRSNRVARVQPR